MKLLTQADVEPCWDSLKAWLAAGELGLIPTDTIYGLTANALDRKAVARAMKLKGRRHPMSLIPHSQDWARLLVLPEDRERFDAAWVELRGPFTMLFRRDPTAIHLPPPYDTSALIGFRQPDHWCSTLAAELGLPLLTTSVNVTRASEMTSLDDLPARLREGVDFCVTEGRLLGPPSTLVTFGKGGQRTVRARELR